MLDIQTDLFKFVGQPKSDDFRRDNASDLAKKIGEILRVLTEPTSSILEKANAATQSVVELDAKQKDIFAKYQSKRMEMNSYVATIATKVASQPAPFINKPGKL